MVDPAAGLPVLVGFTSGIGTRIEPVPVPNVPTLAGAQLFIQWLVNDGAGAALPGFAGLAMSRGGRVTIGN